MPTEQQYRDALLKAHRAGDTRAANLIAQRIKELRESPQEMRATPEMTAQASREVAEEMPFIGMSQTESGIPYVTGRFPAAIGQGMMDIATGAQQRFAEFTGDEERAAELTEDVEQQRARFTGLQEKDPVMSTVGRAIGTTAATPIPGVGQARGARLIGAIGAGLLSGALEATGEDEKWLNNALLAGGFSGGMSALTDVGGKYIAKAINARGKNFKTEDIAEIIEAAKREGIPLTASDISTSKALATNQQIMDELPILGTMGRKEAQAEALERSAQRLVDEFGDVDNVAEGMQASLGRKLKSFKKASTKKFDEAAKALDPVGEVPLDKTMGKIDELIQQQMNMGELANQGLIDDLQRISKANRSKFSDVREVRKYLGRQVGKLEKQLDADPDTKSAYNALFATINNDLDDFAEASGSKQGLKLYKDANNFYRENVVPFKAGKLKSLLKTDKFEDVVKYLQADPSTGGSLSQAKKLFNSLDDDGRRLARGHLIADAFNKAGPDSVNEVFSPGRFAQELKKIEKTTGVFFGAEDKKKIDAIQKLMRTLRGAGEGPARPRTGEKLVPYATGAGSVGVGIASYANPVTLLASVPAYVAARVIASPKSTRYIMASSKATPGSKAFTDAMDGLNRLIRAEAAKQQGKEQ